MAKANGEAEEQQKPFCAVYGVEKNDEQRQQQQNRSPTLGRLRGGNRANVNIRQQYDENSYLSVERTLNIFGNNEEGRRTLENNNDEQNALLTASISPYRVLTMLTHCENADWDELREVRVRELAEVRQRVMLMENTMRWWLSAAEQWREKWLKLKNERSRLREENLRLRNALSFAKVELFELNGLKSWEKCAAKFSKNICINKLICCSPNEADGEKKMHKKKEYAKNSANGRRRRTTI